MAEVTTSLVKALRDKTNAGMMDCKKALLETGGDIEAAVDWLRKKGLSAAAKRSGRVASEGLVGLATGTREAAVVEINSETDFVARNDKFRDFVHTVSQLALAAKGDAERLLATPMPGGGRTVGEELTQLAATIGENITFRRTAYLSVENGIVASYLHSQQAPGLGRIAVLLGIEGAGGGNAVEEIGKKVAMHVAAANPLALSRAEVPGDALERERQVLIEQARSSGKPEAVILKMVEGRLGKFYEDVCLLEQPLVMDPQTKVAGLLDAAGKELGTPLRISGFVRYALGEGLQKVDEPEAA